MEILIIIWLVGLSLFISVYLLDPWISKKFSDENPIKKFWKKHIIDVDPNDKQQLND